MFRRSSADQPDPATAIEPVVQSKGRPTPTRKEAEAARKDRVKPTTDKKTRRQQQTQARVKARAGMAAGDERYLPGRDRGPVRAFARDYVDSRRGLGEYLMPALVLILVGSVIHNNNVRIYSVLAFYGVVLVMLGESVVMAIRLRRIAAARFPDDSTKGVTFYAIMRAIQIRRWRMPKPKVTRGQQV